MSINNKEWSTLDNAAKIFPAILKKSYTSFFRLEAVLKEPIIAEVLIKSLKIVLPRYPLLQVKVRRGVFWYFFEAYDHPIKILPLQDYELCHFTKLFGHNQSPYWRVLVKENRLAIEISHVITDGLAGMEFFRTLLCVYYEEIYGAIKDWGAIKKPEEPPRPEEFEYSYRKYFKKITSIKPSQRNAFKYPDKRTDTYTGTRLHVPLDRIKELSVSHGVSITEFITSIHFFCIQKMYKQQLQQNKGLVTDLILINLRQFFASDTLRNFYLFVMPSINFALGEYSFEEILKKIHCQTQDMLDTKEIQRHFSDYVTGETYMLSRVVPRPIKDLVLSWLQRLSGEKKHTSSLSNLGKISLPKELEKLVSSFAVFPVPSKASGKNLAIIGYGNTLTISIGGYIENLNLEQEMAKFIKSLGVDVSFLEW